MIERKKKITPKMGVTTPKADPLAIARFNSRSHTESDTADTLNSLQYNFNSHSNTGVTERSNINEQTMAFQFTLLYRSDKG